MTYTPRYEAMCVELKRHERENVSVVERRVSSGAISVELDVVVVVGDSHQAQGAGMVDRLGVGDGACEASDDGPWSPLPTPVPGSGRRWRQRR